MKIRIGYGLGTQGMAGGPERWIHLIDELERLRFDSVWFSERVSGAAPDPVVAMTFAVARTVKLKVGMSVMVLPGRNPVLVAKEMASLAVLSGGRVLPAFGLGVADAREQSAFGVTRAERAAMFDEALALMRRCWTEDEVTHHGRYYQVDGVRVRPRPAALDVWLGGVAPSELRRVGRLADGWLPSFIVASEAKALADRVREAADAAGRVIDPEHFGVLIAYTSGAPIGEPFLERIRARRPELDPADLFPVGLDATRATIEGFIDAGFSKFVLVPALELPESITGELEAVAEKLLPLEN